MAAFKERATGNALMRPWIWALKVAFHARDTGQPTHAARQRRMGEQVRSMEDLAHTLAGLESDMYRRVFEIMKRPFPPPVDGPLELP